MSLAATTTMRAALTKLRPDASIRQDILSAGALGLVGDLVCQFAVERRGLRDFEPRRAAAIVAFNTVYIGGFLHCLYKTYPLVVAGVGRLAGTPALARETSTAHRVGCSLVDNAHCGLVYIPVYFLGVAGLSGDDADEARNALREEWATTYFTCSIFWLPYTYLNFATVAPAKRVQFMAAGNLVWSAFIDWLAHRKHNTAEKREPARGYATTVVAGRLAGSPT